MLGFAGTQALAIAGIPEYAAHRREFAGKCR